MIFIVEIFHFFVIFLPRYFIFWGYCECIVFLLSFSVCSLLVYRKGSDFCILILHIDILLLCYKSLWCVRVFLVECLVSFRYKIISSANRDNLTSSFPILIHFISSSCLIALPRNSKITLNKCGKSRHPHLVSDFRGNGFSFPHLEWWWLWFVICRSYVEVCFLYS
jgi:hypothetical protein